MIDSIFHKGIYLGLEHFLNTIKNIDVNNSSLFNTFRV